MVISLNVVGFNNQVIVNVWIQVEQGWGYLLLLTLKFFRVQ